MEYEDGILFISEGYFPTIGKTIKKPTSMKDEEWEVLDRNALGPIHMCMKASMAFNILKEKIAADMMNTLAKLYENPSASNKVFLMKKIFNINMLEGGYVADHLNEFNTVTN
jgi:hypothetical protein